MKLQTLGLLCYLILTTFAIKSREEKTYERNPSFSFGLFDRSVLYQPGPQGPPGPPGKPGHVSKKGIRGHPGLQVRADRPGHLGRGRLKGGMGPFGPRATSGQVGLSGLVGASSYVGDNQENRQALQDHITLGGSTGSSSSSRSYYGYGPPYSSSYLSYNPYLLGPLRTSSPKISKIDIANTNNNNQTNNVIAGCVGTPGMGCPF